MKYPLSSATVTIDLHGKTEYQARIAIDAALRRAGGGVWRIRIIHGYNGGDALRELVRGEYARHPKVIGVQPQGEGVTDLVLRAV